jgi:hypothetical protein
MAIGTEFRLRSLQERWSIRGVGQVAGAAFPGHKWLVLNRAGLVVDYRFVTIDAEVILGCAQQGRDRTEMGFMARIAFSPLHWAMGTFHGQPGIRFIMTLCTESLPAGHHQPGVFRTVGGVANQTITIGKGFVDQIGFRCPGGVIMTSGAKCSCLGDQEIIAGIAMGTVALKASFGYRGMSGSALQFSFHIIVALKTQIKAGRRQKGRAGGSVCRMTIKAIAIGNRFMNSLGSNFILVVTLQTELGGIVCGKGKRFVGSWFIVARRAITFGHRSMTRGSQQAFLIGRMRVVALSAGFAAKDITKVGLGKRVFFDFVAALTKVFNGLP